MDDASKTVEIHIAFELVNQATGGGNQFLKALKRHLQSNNLYQEDLPYGKCYQLNPTYEVPHKWIHDNGLVEFKRKERTKIYSRTERLKRLVLYTIKKLNNGTT